MNKHLFLTCICVIFLVSFLVPPVPAADRSTVVPAQRLGVITTEPVVTTAPVVRGTIVPIAIETTAIIPEGCSCLLASEAARFGTYVLCAETVCGYGDRDATGQPTPKYYYKTASAGIRATVPAGASTSAPGMRITTVPAGVSKISPTVVPPSTGPAQTSAGNVPAVAMNPGITPPAHPPVTFGESPMMQVQPEKPQKGIIETIFSLFSGFFGGGITPGTGNDQPGGNNEPAGDLPPGMKPVTQVTTHVPQGQMPHDITVTSPKTGEKILVTEPLKIAWTMPNNPSGTVSLKLVRHDGGQFTELGHTSVPSTGQYTWYQQDNAHDCGLPGNVACFGGLSLTQMGITDMIQYANAWNLPPAMSCTIDANTDPIDPYPAFHGSSGMFTLKNPYAFFETDVDGDSAGYANVQTGFDQNSPWHHTIYRMVITPDLTGLYENQKVKKATLTLLLDYTNVGTADGTMHFDNSRSSLASVWILSGKYPGEKTAAQTPIKFNYPAPATGGSTGHVSFDSSSGLVTIDMTEGLNYWLSDNTVEADSIVLVGPDESGGNTHIYQHSRYTVVSFTVER